MPFTPKDWHNADTADGGGDESTPWDAAAAEDMEERLGAYTTERTLDVRDFGEGVGLGDSAADTEATVQGLVELGYHTDGDTFARVLKFPSGHFYIDDPQTIHSSCGIVGEHPWGTRFHYGPGFPAGEAMFNVQWTLADSPQFGVAADQVYQDIIVPNPIFRDFAIDGDGRAIQANGIDLRSVGRADIRSIIALGVRGTVLKGINFMETPVYDLSTFYCGDEDHDVFDLFDDSGVASDGSNLLQFIGCRLGLSVGDHLTWGAELSTGVARDLWFIGCVFHGMPPVFSQGYEALTYLYDLVDDSYKSRIVCDNGRGLHFSGCRHVIQARGMPLVQTIFGIGKVNSVFFEDFEMQGSPDPYVGTDMAATASTDTLALGVFYDLFADGHYMTTGSKVRVAGTLPGGLAAATDYYVISTGAKTMKLASSYANSQTATAINLTTDSASFTLTQQDQCIETVSTVNNTLTISNHRLATEARVRIFSETTMPAPLVNTPPGADPAGADYFVGNVDADTIKLYPTRQDAVDATNVIDITTAGSGRRYLIPIHFLIDHELGVLDVGRGGMVTSDNDTVTSRAFIRLESGYSQLYIDPTGPFPLTRTVVERWDGLAHYVPIRGGVYIEEALQMVMASGNIGLAISNHPSEGLVFGPASGANPGHAVLTASNGKLAGIGVGSTTSMLADNNGVAFNGSYPIAKPAVTGSRGGNAALADLLTKLALLGLITDSTSA